MIKASIVQSHVKTSSEPELTNDHYISTLEREIKALNINSQQSISISNVRTSISNINYSHLALPNAALNLQRLAQVFKRKATIT